MSTVTVESGPNVPPSCARKDGDPWPLYDLSRLQEKPSLYVIAVSFGKFPLAARFLNNTVTLCPDKVEPGAFDKRNILVFWMPDSDNDVSRGVNEVFFDENIQRHPIVIAIRGSAKETEDPSLAFSLLSWRFNPYAGKLVPQAFPVKFDDNNLFNKKSFFYSFALQVIQPPSTVHFYFFHFYIVHMSCLFSGVCSKGWVFAICPLVPRKC